MLRGHSHGLESHVGPSVNVFLPKVAISTTLGGFRGGGLTSWFPGLYTVYCMFARGEGSRVAEPKASRGGTNQDNEKHAP